MSDWRAARTTVPKTYFGHSLKKYSTPLKLFLRKNWLSYVDYYLNTEYNKTIHSVRLTTAVWEGTLILLSVETVNFRLSGTVLPSLHIVLTTNGKFCEHRGHECQQLLHTFWLYTCFYDLTYKIHLNTLQFYLKVRITCMYIWWWEFA